jgi:hypothetical protein
MPIILFGERGLTSRLDSGTFYCPQCDGERRYTLNQVRPWFTLYFIPIFPVGSADRFVECQSCGGKFVEDILEMPPPSEGQRLMSEMVDALQEGASVETVEGFLRDRGLDAEQAHSVAADLAGPDTWECRTCKHHYIKAVPRCRRCAG